MNSLEPGYNNTQINVLHIEDNFAYVNQIQEGLNEVGADNIKVVHCSRLSDIRHYLHTHDIDIIMLDFSVADSSGVDTVSYIRQLIPDKALIVLTDTSSEETGLLAVQMGAQDYIVKENSGGAVLVKSIKYAIERQRIESKIREQALTDGLTELPNRAYFMDYLKKTLFRSQRASSKIILLYLDFDGFKQINDTYGHHQGDAFLQEVARRLKGLLRGSDFCARLGGDEFAVIAEIDKRKHLYAVPLIEKILMVMRNPFRLDSGVLVSSFCSIGVALFSGETDSANEDTLIRQADEAMYRAKRAGGDCFRLYDEKFAEESKNTSTMVLQLRSAIQKNQFFIEYQPIISVQTGKACGMEALLRWNNQYETVPPSVFIKHLESNALIHAVGKWVLENACRDFHAQCNPDDEQLWLSVNISPLQLNSLEFLECVSQIMSCYRKDYPWLILEITERVLMNNTDHVIKILNKLSDLGVLMAIDDFGTGYSNMQYLMDIPAYLLKIDRSFTYRLLDSDSHKSITRGMIGLSHTLGKQVVVEGVESQYAADLLQDMGANYLQGFHYSRPAPLENFCRRVV